MTNPVKTALLQPRHGILTPIYRELRPMEHYMLQDHLIRLSPETRAWRFGGPVSERIIVNYARNEGQPMPIICGAFIGDTLRGVVELRFDRDKPRHTAELAISVEDDWQDIGIGTRLMALALRCARDNGIARLEVNFLPHNAAMRRLAWKFGASFSHQTGLTKGIFSLSGRNFADVAGSKRPQ
ncbi:GNAT family N-acetyltransferase [Sneathiella sp. HT1-7]|uniref:GNAT family N-acetyltransferase n=1 Tax=Sneathiella sp. HT1-7 TaxID=2887192 RepID=UPI001D140FC7|nr:GNAT family N-acetyltransferase [Sneathiella sp. HT1-7]MCC3303980.1 GNAT family N-acetyltransferase [Sneathiella sp. HT1-7]